MNEILTKIVNTLSKLEKRVSNEDKIAKALGTLDFNVPFSTGLTIVVAGGAKIVVIYE